MARSIAGRQEDDAATPTGGKQPAAHALERLVEGTRAGLLGGHDRERRLGPIARTTLTAIGALLPLALSGHALYAPLARVIFGELICSTLLARTVTPVLYRVWPPEITT